MLKKAVVFGGQQDKLVAEGPFLALRHKFQERLLGTNKLAVIGYRFGDKHINALIRSWLQTRRNAKMIIVDPSESPMLTDLRRYTLRQDEKTKQIKSVVEIDHIPKGFASSIDALSRALAAPPNPAKYALEKVTNEPVNVLADWMKDAKTKPAGLLGRYLQDSIDELSQ